MAPSISKLSRSLAGWGVAILATFSLSAQAANSVPYSNVGTYNNAAYSFTAAQSGHVFAYMVGGFSAAYENELSLLVNGTLSPVGFGLNNHTSSVGTTFDLGEVHAGDALVFVLRNYTLHRDLYSDAAMNTTYDYAGASGHNHIYSVDYTASVTFSGVPSGTYVGFEDQRFPASDYNYNDLSFVFTNVSVATNGGVSAVPEPQSLAMLMAGLAAVAGASMRRRRVEQEADAPQARV